MCHRQLAGHCTLSEMPSPTPMRDSQVLLPLGARTLLPAALSLSQVLPAASCGKKLPIAQQTGYCLSYLTRAYVSSSSAAIQAMSARVGTGGTSLRYKSEMLGSVCGKQNSSTNTDMRQSDRAEYIRGAPNLTGQRGGFLVGSSLNKRPEAREFVGLQTVQHGWNRQDWGGGIAKGCEVN